MNKTLCSLLNIFTLAMWKEREITPARPLHKVILFEITALIDCEILKIISRQRKQVASL